jgi:hypothetical protein
MVRRTAAADAASTCAAMERRLGSTDLLLQAMNRAMGIPVPLFWIGWLGRSCLLGERERERETMKKLTVRHGIDQAKKNAQQTVQCSHSSSSCSLFLGRDKLQHSLVFFVHAAIYMCSYTMHAINL